MYLEDDDQHFFYYDKISESYARTSYLFQINRYMSMLNADHNNSIVTTIVCFILIFWIPANATTLDQISKDHAVYIQAQNGDNLSITTERRLGTDPDLIYIYGPDGKLQDRLEIMTDTTTNVALTSGTGVYKVLPVNYTFIHTYTITPSRPIVVEPFAHHELIRVEGSADLYFEVPPGATELVFHAHSMQSSGTITEELYDPGNNLIHTFVLPPDTFQSDRPVPPKENAACCNRRATGTVAIGWSRRRCSLAPRP